MVGTAELRGQGGLAYSSSSLGCEEKTSYRQDPGLWRKQWSRDPPSPQTHGAALPWRPPTQLFCRRTFSLFTARGAHSEVSASEGSSTQRGFCGVQAGPPFRA